MRYRDGRPEDADDLSRFARDTFVGTFGHLYPPADLEAFLVDRYEPGTFRKQLQDPARWVRLALDGTDMVGYAMVGPLTLPVDGPGLELARLYVAERVRGAGVAARLMADVIDHARRQRAPALYLSVYEDNERAMRFYRRYGFEEVGEHAFMVGSVRDRDLIWRLDLERPANPSSS